MGTLVGHSVAGPAFRERSPLWFLHTGMCRLWVSDCESTSPLSASPHKHTHVGRHAQRATILHHREVTIQI